MTFYGWDASNHDWDRGPMDLARAKKEGIALFTHKVAEGIGFYDDPYFKPAMDRANAVGFDVVGGYYVNHPGDQIVQADHFVDLVNRLAPWWRQHPCWVWQIDAEKFDYMTRAPSVAEINAFGDRVVAKTGCSPKAILVYAPAWLYGNSLGGLKYRNLWSSSYVSGSGPFKNLYPGDKGFGWNVYSGIQPIIWQFTDAATIAGQGPADANAIRVASVAELHTLFGGNGDDDMPSAQEVAAAVWAFPFKNVKANSVASAQQRLFDEVGGHAYSADHGVVTLNAQVAALNARVDALTTVLNHVASGSGTGVDIESIKQQIDAQIKASLENVHLDVVSDAPSAPVAGG